MRRREFVQAAFSTLARPGYTTKTDGMPWDSRTTLLLPRGSQKTLLLLRAQSRAN
jgi:hypothetical protein